MIRYVVKVIIFSLKQITVNLEIIYFKSQTILTGTKTGHNTTCHTYMHKYDPSEIIF